MIKEKKDEEAAAKVAKETNSTTVILLVFDALLLGFYFATPEYHHWVSIAGWIAAVVCGGICLISLVLPEKLWNSKPEAIAWLMTLATALIGLMLALNIP